MKKGAQPLTVYLSPAQFARFEGKITQLNSRDTALARARNNSNLRAVRWDKESRFAYGVVDTELIGQIFKGKGAA